MKRLLSVAVAGLLIAGVAAPLPAEASASDVLALAPADAWAVICVRNLGEMDQKLNTFIQQTNAPIPVQNPLSMGLSMFGFISGVDSTGSVGMVVLPGPSFQDLQARTVLLIPTNNLDELLSLLEPEEVEPGVCKVMIQNADVFVAHKQSHAIVGASVESVKTVLAAPANVRTSLSAHQLKAFNQDDVTVWLNAQAITTGEAYAAMLPVLQAINVNVEMLADVRTAALSLRLEPQGIVVGGYADAKPGTPMFRGMASQKGTEGSLLVGLPRERSVLSYGAVSSKEASAAGANMLSQMLENPQVQALGLDPVKIKEVVALLEKQFERMRGVAVNVCALPEGPDGLVSMVKVVTVDGDPREVLSHTAELVASVKGGLIPQEGAAGVLDALAYRSGAETLAGVSVDHLVVDLTKAVDPDDPETEAWLGQITKVLGKEGILVRLAAVGEHHVVVTFGGGAARFEQVAGLVSAGQAPLAQDGGIQRTGAQLPAPRSAEGYLQVDQLLDLIATIARVADAQMPPLSLGELNAPIAFGAQPVEPGGIQAVVFIPMELVIAVKDLAMGMATAIPPPPPAVEPTKVGVSDN
ncbi:MAG: hypothetical protein GY842_01190 [bacterium]|nr:hypothetical protein [bacterium]